MPPAPSGVPSTPPSVSVRAWLDRVEPYVVHDPQTGQITGIRLGPAAINDERAAYAMCAAAEYLKASVIPERPALQDLEIRQRSRRNLWLMWAREVLADAGAPELADSATFYSFRAGYSELSAEHFAAGLDYACRCLDAAQDVHERALIEPARDGEQARRYPIFHPQSCMITRSGTPARDKVPRCGPPDVVRDAKGLLLDEGLDSLTAKSRPLAR
jgi:hypothetical protein